MSNSFGKRLQELMAQRGPLCVGIDPHPKLLLQWGLSDDARGLREFALQVTRVLGPRAAALKPQSALFERHGSAGIAVLEEVLALAKEVGTLSILDVKRGDIGSTMTAYAQAYLEEGRSLAADAITLSPYLGYESLRPALDLALENQRGVFVLALTSNPEGASVQLARPDEHYGNPQAQNLAQDILGRAGADNQAALAQGHWGSVGVVIGATVGEKIAGCEAQICGLNGPILAPGVGAQGAGAKELQTVFAAGINQVLASSSRAILEAGPTDGSLTAAFENSLEKVVIALTAEKSKLPSI